MFFGCIGGVGEESALDGVASGDEGGRDFDDRVNQGGLLGRVSSRVVFAAAVILFARLE